ncbi:hypothetical protein MJT46_007453 [Ovis ammon polii x Ovis aries]|nr:hypothetical protein MJT46_007453 [Ovis ammon polii x Ovis aries]
MGLKRTLRRHMRGSQRSASLLSGPPWTREPYRERVCAVGGLQLGVAVAARAKGHACETTESFVPATRNALQLDSLDQKQEQKLFDTVLLLRKSLIVSDAKQVLHEYLLNSVEPATGRSHSPQAEGGERDRKGENTGGLGSQRQIQKQSQAPLTCESGPSHLSRQPLLHLIRFLSPSGDSSVQCEAGMLSQSPSQHCLSSSPPSLSIFSAPQDFSVLCFHSWEFPGLGCGSIQKVVLTPHLVRPKTQSRVGLVHPLDSESFRRPQNTGVTVCIKDELSSVTGDSSPRELTSLSTENAMFSEEAEFAAKDHERRAGA